MAATPSVDWLAIAPELALGGAAVLVVLLRAVLRQHRSAMPVALVVTGIGILTAAAMLVWQWYDVRDHGPITTFGDMVRVDAFGVYLGIVIVIATALAVLTAVSYLRRENLEAPEFLALMLFSSLGMVIMTTAADLIVVFLALEILSIPLYVLAAFDRRRLSSQEAGIKYFVLGAFSSAIFLYGIALVYGATGSTSLSGILQFLSEQTLLEQGTLVAGLMLLLVGLGFKVAAVPFHTWTPDVYQGAPTPVTTFMASATKAAGFAALLRVFGTAFPQYRADWRPAVWVLAALTLLVGSIGAALQTDIKRLLAYSSIAHAGYVLMAFQVATPKGVEAAVFYLFVYTFMVVGSFTVVTALAMHGDANHSIDGYRGLASRRPVLGSLLILFMLAQAGIPLTGGFIAKIEVFEAASSAGEYWLVVVGALATVIGAFAYLRVALAVATNPDADADTAADADAARTDASGVVATGGGVATVAVTSARRVDFGTGLVLFTAATMTLVLGVVPAAFITWASHAGFGL